MADLGDFSTPDQGNGPPGPRQIATQRPYIDVIGHKLWRCERPGLYVQQSGEGAESVMRATSVSGTVTVTRAGVTVATKTTG